jgi:hypothetical protein
MEDDRKAILARRAGFVAAALAGLGASCASDPKPATQTPTQAEIIVPKPEGGPDEEASDAALPGRTSQPEPEPPKKKPYPMICLSEY